MLARAGGVVQADLRLERAAGVADVELVGQRVPGDGVAVGVQRDPAVAVVADQADERAGVGEVDHRLLVGRPW